MTRLPVRTNADVHLADAFGAPGCPLCRERSRAQAAWLESILAESVNDIPFRQALDAARGFCGHHAAEILDADRRRAGSLGAAILLRATLVPRLRELEAVHAARGWARTRRMTEAARPPACPACERSARTDAGRAESVVHLTADAAWAEAVAAAPVCLEHLVALMAVRPAPAAWSTVEERQLARLGALRDLLDAYSHTSSHDRRHRQTDAQRASPDQASALLAGGSAAPSTTPVAIDRPASPPDARAVVLTGVYGSGKSTTAVEIASRLEAAGVASAVIDVDWLGWYSVPGGWDEHDDPRLTLANLAAMRAMYLEAGVRSFVLAWRIRDAAQLNRLRETLAMPLSVIRLEAPLEVIERRLASDPTTSRADDLAVAAADIATGDAALPAADATIDADQPVTVVAEAVLVHLGWATPH
ncbi:MAG TPA: DUF6062 family protein [Candidatus Limnocylindrales bacterium]